MYTRWALKLSALSFGKHGLELLPAALTIGSLPFLESLRIWLASLGPRVSTGHLLEQCLFKRPKMNAWVFICAEASFIDLDTV